MGAFEAWLRAVPWCAAAALALAENVLVLSLALLAGQALRALYAHRPLTLAPPLTRLEVLVGALAVVINSAVTLAGLALWRANIVHFRRDAGLRAALDVLVLIGVMDLAMYILHRVAHARLFFKPLHALHHRFERARPLTLFVLSPLEVAAFGSLWLVVISVYSSSWLGMSVYLALNVAFGTLGHLGVEPLPRGWVRWPALRHVGTTTFHAQHHLRPTTNYGFYTLIWDRLFGTLHPDYETAFGEPLEDRPSGYFKP